jgi:hypothetical protein
MRQRNLDLVLSAAIATLAALLNWLWPDQALLRAIFGMPLALVLPGYVLMEAMFSPGTLGLPVRLLYSCGLSISVLIVLGLAANAAGVKLGTAFWSLALWVVSVAAAGAAAVRRRSFLESWPRQRLPRWRVYHVGLLALAVAVVAASLLAARQPASASGVSGYTLLWLLPAPGPVGREVKLGITSGEFEPTHYILELKADSRVVQTWPEIDLAPGANWTGLAMMPVGSQQVEADLYRADAPKNIYRYVLLKP